MTIDASQVDAAAIEELIELYGDPLLRYLLNVEPGEDLLNIVCASTARLTVASDLRPIEDLARLSEMDRDNHVAAFLAGTTAGGKRSRANACRLACGGELPSVGAAPLDELEAAVGALAVDASLP